MGQPGWDMWSPWLQRRHLRVWGLGRKGTSDADFKSAKILAGPTPSQEEVGGSRASDVPRFTAQAAWTSAVKALHALTAAWSES